MTHGEPDETYLEAVRDRNERAALASAHARRVLEGDEVHHKAIEKLAEAVNNLAAVLVDVSDDCAEIRAAIALNESERQQS